MAKCCPDPQVLDPESDTCILLEGWQDRGLHFRYLLVKASKWRKRKSFLPVNQVVQHMKMLGDAQVVGQVTGIDLTKPASERSH